MQDLRILLIISALTIISVIDGQFQPNLCLDTPANIPDPKWRQIPYRFEIMTELVDANDIAEFAQAFSPVRDSVALNSRAGSAQIYWNFATNEKFDIMTAILNGEARQLCVREEIRSTTQTSVMVANTLILKPSILLGFDARNQRNSQWAVRYVGDEDLDGTPTNKFTSCFYVNDIQATVSATYYRSDPTKFVSSSEQNNSLIVRINADVFNPAGQKESYQYNVIRFVPNPSRAEQRQALETPAHVYCPNRTSTLSPPQNLPDRMRQNSDIFSSQFNSSIINSATLYDIDLQLFQTEVWYPDVSGGPEWFHDTLIEDFGTGLKYLYNSATYQCSVSDISSTDGDAVIVDGKPSYIQMGSAQHIFSMDDITFQYTGEKQCRDRIWCHVWMGEKTVPDNIVRHIEWYWASRFNDEPLQEWFPVKLIGTTYINSSVADTFETSIFNYDPASNMFSEMDGIMTNCYRSLSLTGNFNHAIISFTLANDQEYPVQNNIEYLRSKIRQTLTQTLQVRPLRLANIIVDRNGTDLPVTFTLLDTPPRLGPIEFPFQELTVTAAIERLRTMIDANGLVFKAKYDAKDVSLRARMNSLQAIYTNLDQSTIGCANETDSVQRLVPDECPERTTDPNLSQNIEIVYQSSGPLITGFWIGFIILGVLIGTVGGFFALKRFFRE